MSTCVFCEIVAGRSPASVVHEDDRVVAIMDIGPVNPGHTLVLPKDHLPYLADLSDDIAAEVFLAGKRIAAAIRATELRSEGINLWWSDGEAAFQDVFHAHLHVLPRFVGDGFRIDADWSQRPPRDVLDRHAAMIGAALR